MGRKNTLLFQKHRKAKDSKDKIKRSCDSKIPYDSYEKAMEIAGKTGTGIGRSAYLCMYCMKYHVASRRNA